MVRETSIKVRKQAYYLVNIEKYNILILPKSIANKVNRQTFTQKGAIVSKHKTKPKSTQSIEYWNNNQI